MAVMTPIAIGWLLVAVVSAVGILLWFVARPMAKASQWWQSFWTRKPGLRWAKQFMYDETTEVVIIRLVGMFFVVFAVIGAILLIAVPFPPS